ncbi:MAG: hypothetical protein ACYTE8_13315 [Planctomycetota bacterium]|jgi:hypothetical protein
MKALKNDKLIFSAIVFFLTAAFAYAYPPDNAAVLYYKAAEFYGAVDPEMTDMLDDFRDGKIELDDEIRAFVNNNRLIIETVLDASEVKNCDWGMNPSQGLNMLAPPMYSIKKLSQLIATDAKILAEDGHYGPAIHRCMSLYKMARHINDRNLICYLVGIAVTGMTNNCLINIISDMPQHTRNMTRLKNDLIEIDSIPLSIKPALLGEREAVLIFMTLEQIPDVVRTCVQDEAVKEKLLSADEAFLEANRRYFENYYSGVIAAFDMPYSEGYSVMMDLSEKVDKDAKSDPDVILAAVLMPATHKIFSLKTRFQTHNNAIKTAIELFLIKAKTGTLPEKLPANLPGDMFSGKPFDYEITSEGFILRCQGRDLGKDELYEYEFKTAE